MKGKVTGYLLIVLGLVLVIRTAGNVYRLWKAGERLEKATWELSQAEEKNKQLTEQVREAKTPEFMERQVREKLGYGREGEVVLIIPEEVAPPFAKATEGLQPNWVRWRKLYLGF